MAHLDLIDAFNDCVDRLHAGQSLEECLRLYPHYAAELRPMLQTAQAVRRAEPDLSAAARARMRAQVLGAAPFVTGRRASRSRVRGVTLLAAALVMVLFAGVLITLLNRDDDPALQPVPSASATPAATDTPGLTPTPAATQTLAPSPTASATSGITASPANTPTPAPSATHTPETCTIQVTPSSVNLRAGPGTGYSVVDYAFAGDVLPVVARHTSGLWYAVEAGSETLWIAASVGDLRGACDAVPVSDEPYREGTVVDDAPTGETGGAPGAPGDAAGGDDDDDDDDDRDDDDDDDD